MNDDKTSEGKQAGPSMCQHHELIFICRQSDLTTSLPTSAPKAPSCSLTHTAPRDLPAGSVYAVTQGVELEPAHRTALFRMCWGRDICNALCHQVRACAETQLLWGSLGLNLSYSCISRLQWQKGRPGSPTMPPTVALDKTLCYQLLGMRQQQQKLLWKISVF